MSFDLHISVRERPHHRESVSPEAGRVVTIDVNGTFTDTGGRELERVVCEYLEDDADSVLVELQQVVVSECGALAHFAEKLMAQRAEGRQVQVLARDPALHATCSAIDRADDWLIASMTDDVSGGRRSLYVEGTE